MLQLKKNYNYLTQFFLLAMAAVLLCSCASLRGRNYSAQGNYYFAQDNFNEAAEYYKKAIENDQEKSEYLSLLAWSYFKLGNFDQAIKIFDRLEDKDASALDAYTGRGWCNFKKSNFDEAIKYFGKAAYIDPNSAEAFAGLGWCAFRKQDAQGAEKYFNISLAKAMRYKKGVSLKTEPEAHRGLGYLKFSQGDFKTSLRHFKIATELMPSWNDARIKWGDSLAALAKHKDALKVYGYALKYAKSAEIYDKIGWSYFSLQKYKCARDMFTKALSIDPAYASSLSGLAELEKKNSLK